MRDMSPLPDAVLVAARSRLIAAFGPPRSVGGQAEPNPRGWLLELGLATRGWRTAELDQAVTSVIATSRYYPRISVIVASRPAPPPPIPARDDEPDVIRCGQCRQEPHLAGWQRGARWVTDSLAEGTGDVVGRTRCRCAHWDGDPGWATPAARDWWDDPAWPGYQVTATLREIAARRLAQGPRRRTPGPATEPTRLGTLLGDDVEVW